MVGIASVVFSLAESKPLFDSIWWGFVTSMTVGYGDMYPTTLVGRIDAIILMLISVFFVGPMIIAKMVQILTPDRNQFSHEEQEEIKETLRELRNRK